MQEVFKTVLTVAPLKTTVLITGECGTGKELVAKAIHFNSPRARRPLVTLNCAAIPENLLESELFGHERGSFTDAHQKKLGQFEMAHEGTLFLDEIGEMSLALQAKLLRVLEHGEFLRVGGQKPIQVDVRIIAATNRDLAQGVGAGRFREDLWYRLNVFPISVPPLRQRKDDIPTLAQAFVQRTCQRLGRPVLDLPQSVVQALQARDWPGNVRELQNVIEQAVLVSDGPHLRLSEHERLEPAGTGSGVAAPQSLEDVERKHILEVLASTDWKLEGRDGAAAVLGLKPSTLRSRMQKLEIRRPE
jgi:transcriptional regulator with GAF, ATPase, and Fis domain